MFLQGGFGGESEVVTGLHNLANARQLHLAGDDIKVRGGNRAWRVGFGFGFGSDRSG
jgi:hypothetical protein